MSSAQRKSMQIGTKLWVLSGLLLGVLSLVASVAYWQTKNLADEINYLTETMVPAVRNMTLADMMHDGIRANAFHAILESGNKDPEVIKEIADESKEMTDNIKLYMKKLQEIGLPDDTLNAIAPAIPKIDSYVDTAKQLVSFALAGKLDQALATMPALTKSFSILEKDLDVLGDKIQESAETAKEHSLAAAKKAILILCSLYAFGLVFGLILAALIIKDLKKVLITSVTKLSEESVSVIQTASVMSKFAEQFSTNASDQASALQETAASIDEISAMVRKTSDNTQKLEHIASESNKSATRGQDAMTQMQNAMETIKTGNEQIMTQINRSNERISEIAHVIADIDNKTKVINDIVFQTKLLSFNASVEAARAGEHGKGFAVVAEEVGNLAQMSGNAAREISAMLTSSISRVEGIITENKGQMEALIEDGKSKLNHGATIAGQCQQALSEIVSQSSEVASMVCEIATAIKEQNQGIEEISKAISQMDTSTQNNSATTQQTFVILDKLNLQSSNLEFIINSLKRLVTTQTSEAMPSAVAAETAKIVTIEPRIAQQEIEKKAA